MKARFTRLTSLLLILAITVFTSCLASSHFMRVKIGDEPTETVYVSRELSLTEKQQLYDSLDLIAYLRPYLRYSDFRDIPIYWMSSSKYAGLTMYKTGKPVIYLDDTLKLKSSKDNYGYFKLGAVMVHELGHAVSGFNEDEVNRYIDTPLMRSLVKDPITTARLFSWRPSSK